MAWLGPLRPPAAGIKGALGLGEATSALFAGHAWLWVAIAIGAVPVALAALPATHWHQVVTALLVFALVVGAIHAGQAVRGLAAVALAFVAHCAVAIVIARFMPPGSAAAMFPGGAEYWAATHTWLTTGVDPEYELASWVPAHLQLAGAMLVLGYLSMGLIPFMQGFHEVDLMNFYVGRLLASSDDSTVSLALGWHPWSLMRGVGFTLVVFTIAAASYQRFTGRQPEAWRLHALRLGAGIAFLGLDALLKLTIMEPVRHALASRLTGA